MVEKNIVAKYETELLIIVDSETTDFFKRKWLKNFIAQSEWTSLIIHDLRSGKFRCTNSSNKLRVREEKAFFWPTSVDKTPWRDFVLSSKMTNLQTEY